MNLVETTNRLLFKYRVRGICRTPPLGQGSSPFTALSMVHHRDVHPYLLALKSFARYAQPGAVVMVADPTITAEDRALIRDHVPHVQLRDAREFRRDGIPQGGCWERLSAISEYVASSYVVQLDADTVTVAPVPDVVACIDGGRCFTLGTEDNQAIGSTADIAAWARGRLDGQDHIQVLAESVLDQFDPEGRCRYVRGCAGFAGFARGSIGPEALLEVSRGMAALMGKRWSAWGTEQFTSNLLVSSAPGARVLPHPTYCAPHRRTAATVFFHFIGYVRYSTGLYPQLAHSVARELRRAAT